MLTSVPFLASMGFTPGTNNIMVASSGVNFVFRATIPHILGITVGFPLMLLLVGLGLARIFIAVPWVHLALKVASILFAVICVTVALPEASINTASLIRSP